MGKSAEKHVDSWLLVAFFLLMLLGIIMVYSASAIYAESELGDHAYYLKRHLVQLLVGLVALALAYSFPYESLRGKTGILMAGTIVLLMYAAFVEQSRWIRLGFVNFQAVDVAKMALIVFFADSLSRKEKILTSYSEGLFPHLFYLALCGFLVLIQPDFSSAAMLVAIGLTILFSSPVKVAHLALTGLAFVPAAMFAVWRSPYKLARVMAFLNPGADIQGSGYQVHQSLVSLGHGGISGLGFAGSTQKMFFLPEAHTDFIFAIIGEEWGLIGTLVVVAIFTVIMLRGLKLASQINDGFYRYLVIGITAHFFYYGVVNMMVTLQLMPATGLPLPFISYGGTALVVSCAYAGMLLKIANQRLGVAAPAPRRRSARAPRSGPAVARVAAGSKKH